MTPAMVAALSSGRFTATFLCQADLPSGTKRLMFGSGECIWGANTFKGFDSTWGSLDSTADISEQADGTAPNSAVSIVPAPGVDRETIAGPGVQLSRFQGWLACLTLDASKHVIVVPDPEPLFDGFIDQASINLDANRDDIDYTLISAFDYFFEEGEGQRLNGSFHQMVWPGETGLDNVTGVTKKLYWGANAPPGSRHTSSSIYGGVGTSGGAGITRVLHGVISGWAGT